MKERFCPYKNHWMPDEGFKFVLHPASGTKRGMCPLCQANRRKPRSELQRMADEERQERIASERARTMKKAETQP